MKKEKVNKKILRANLVNRGLTVVEFAKLHGYNVHAVRRVPKRIRNDQNIIGEKSLQILRSLRRYET